MVIWIFGFCSRPSFPNLVPVGTWLRPLASAAPSEARPLALRSSNWAAGLSAVYLGNSGTSYSGPDFLLFSTSGRPNRLELGFLRCLGFVPCRVQYRASKLAVLEPAFCRSYLPKDQKAKWCRRQVEPPTSESSNMSDS